MLTIQVVAGIILYNNQVLIAQRPIDKHKGGYWEFPGGKVEAEETSEAALIRELKEELDIQIETLTPFTQVDFTYPEKSVDLKFFLVTAYHGEAKGMEGQPVKWVSIDQLKNIKFPEANLPVVEKLITFLQS